ncbi:uncharacterized protein SPPG_04516, partial [Spizellomyces punctatus DAOM BR117]
MPYTADHLASNYAWGALILSTITLLTCLKTWLSHYTTFHLHLGIISSGVSLFLILFAVKTGYFVQGAKLRPGFAMLYLSVDWVLYFTMMGYIWFVSERVKRFEI